MRSAKGHMKQLGPGRWWVGKEGAPDPVTGKRTQPGFVVRGSRVDAAVALAAYIGEGLPRDTTWNAFYAQVVEPTFVNLSKRTASDYRRLWEVELKHRIGNERVADMDWQRANEVLTDISAPTVQRYAGRFLKKMCNMAIRDRAHLLVVNPVDKTIQYAPHRKRQKVLVEADGVFKFLENIQGIKYEPLILCELGAGCRPEEARALLWEDVSAYDFKGVTYCVLSIGKALTVVDHAPYLKDTKNEPSARDAVMGEPFASRMLVLSEWKNGPLVPSGAPYDESKPEAWYTSPTTIAHNWKQWCKRHKVEHVTEENMRSSYASMMGEAMVPDSVVAGNMGHTDGTTKSKHYQRVTMRAKCMAADMLAESLEDFRKPVEKPGCETLWNESGDEAV